MQNSCSAAHLLPLAPLLLRLKVSHHACGSTGEASWCFLFRVRDRPQQYNQGTTGAYCAACCSNTDVSGDTWTFSCPLASTAFADFVNHFGWEFRECGGICGN